MRTDMCIFARAYLGMHSHWHHDPTQRLVYVLQCIYIYNAQWCALVHMSTRGARCTLLAVKTPTSKARTLRACEFTHLPQQWHFTGRCLFVDMNFQRAYRFVSELSHASGCTLPVKTWCANNMGWMHEMEYLHSIHTPLSINHKLHTFAGMRT